MLLLLACKLYRVRILYNHNVNVKMTLKLVQLIAKSSRNEKESTINHTE